MKKRAKKFRQSTRNIAMAILTVGVLSVSSATGLLMVTACGEAGDTCLASAVMFGLPLYVDQGGSTGNLSGSTPTTPPEALFEPTMVEAVLVMVQATGIYLILIAVIILILLESMELYYLRKLVGKRKFGCFYPLALRLRVNSCSYKRFVVEV